MEFSICARKASKRRLLREKCVKMATLARELIEMVVISREMRQNCDFYARDASKWRLLLEKCVEMVTCAGEMRQNLNSKLKLGTSKFESGASDLAPEGTPECPHRYEIRGRHNCILCVCGAAIVANTGEAKIFALDEASKKKFKMLKNLQLYLVKQKLDMAHQISLVKLPHMVVL